MKIDKVRCRETINDMMLYVNSISYFNRTQHNISVVSPYTNRLLDCGVFLIGLPMVYMGDVSGVGKYNAYGSAGIFEEGVKYQCSIV